jgi:beta-lactamase class A
MGQNCIDIAVSDFVEQEPHRAVALESLRGPQVKSSMNAQMELPAASLAKLPLASAIYELAANGELALAERVRRRDLGQTAYPSILEIFSHDHVFSIGELCGLMLATSDNPTSQYLLDRVGFDRVNAEARRLGAKSTRIVVGFRDEVLGGEGRGNVTTAEDVLAMLKALASSAHSSLISALRNSVRNFRMPLRLPDALPVAHKTGSLVGVAVDAGIAFGRNVDLAVAFLSDEQSDTALTSVAIGDCMGRIWDCLGEEVPTSGQA